MNFASDNVTGDVRLVDAWSTPQENVDALLVEAAGLAETVEAAEYAI